MASRDVQDILGISANTEPRPRPKKKAKISHPRPDGISREVLALYGERAPPVPIEDTKKYKAKRSLPTVKVSWQQSRFQNQARTDDLLLRHWHQKRDPIRSSVLEKSDSATEGDTLPDAPPSDTAVPTTDEAEKDNGSVSVEKGEYRFAKYNLQIETPSFDRGQYETTLRSDTWSQEETEYLLELHKDFYGKWPLIADRYEFRVQTNGDVKVGGSVHIYQERTMEDMKARFYEVSAKIMETHTAPARMTLSEFENHEKMLKFNPKQETERKRQQEALLTRTKDEKKEEEFLLAELRRIYIRQRRNEDERADLRERLDHSLTDGTSTGPSYTTSSEINTLFQKMLAKDKNQKAQRRTAFEEQGGAGGAPNHGASSAGIGSSNNTIQPGTTKRGSMVPGATPTRRPLTAASEVRFGVTTHERLASGVTFRSDKLLKLRQAKSAAQTQKIATILGELQVPDLLQMPSMAVCGAMERLVSRVSLLIEARRTKEKDENDLAVAKQFKALKKGDETTPKGAKPKVENTAGDGDVEMPDAEPTSEAAMNPNADADADGEQDENDAEADDDNEGENEAENEEENEEENEDEEEVEQEDENEEDQTGAGMDVDNSDGEQASSEREEEEEQEAADAEDDEEQADSEREEEEEQAAADREAAMNGGADGDSGEDVEDEQEDEDEEDEEEDRDGEGEGAEDREDGNEGSGVEGDSAAPTAT